MLQTMYTSPVVPTPVYPPGISYAAPRDVPSMSQQHNSPYRSLASTPSTATLYDEEVHNVSYKSNSMLGSDGFYSSPKYCSGVDHVPMSPFVHEVFEPSEDELVPFDTNARATPYVATVVRQRAPTDSPSPFGNQVVWQKRHKWMTPFRAGSVTDDPSVRRSYAADVVRSGPWDTSVVSELAGKFCERVVEGVESSQNVGPFAKEVYDWFRIRLGELPASLFENQIRSCVLSEFRAWWMARLPTALANLPVTSPAPPTSPARLLSSALAIAAFVGDIFSAELASGSFVLLCLQILAENLSVVEEVQAIYAIINHSNERLYERVRMKEFLSTLEYKAQMLGEGATVTAQYNVPEVTQHYLEAITNVIEGWATIADTPSPSEASDTATVYSDDNPERAPTTIPVPPSTPQHLPHTLYHQEVPPPPYEEPYVVQRTSVPIRGHHSEDIKVPSYETTISTHSPQEVSPKKRWADVVRA
ncbi:hypothetical protein ABKN59_006619 [Abortiporus biennis]